MKKYEIMIIVNASLDDAQFEALEKRLFAPILENGGSIDNVDNWGKRKLAYEINGLSDGDYTLIDFHADPQSIAELDRVLRINDAVMRHMVVARADRD